MDLEDGSLRLLRCACLAAEEPLVFCDGVTTVGRIYIFAHFSSILCIYCLIT